MLVHISPAAKAPPVIPGADHRFLSEVKSGDVLRPTGETLRARPGNATALFQTDPLCAAKNQSFQSEQYRLRPNGRVPHTSFPTFVLSSQSSVFRDAPATFCEGLLVIGIIGTGCAIIVGAFLGRGIAWFAASL